MLRQTASDVCFSSTLTTQLVKCKEAREKISHESEIYVSVYVNPK